MARPKDHRKTGNIVDSKHNHHTGHNVQIERRSIWGVELLQPFLVHAAEGPFVLGMPVGVWLSGRRPEKPPEPIAWSRGISFSMFALGAAQGIWGQPAHSNFHLNQF
jgi:hypothetical protein